MAGLHPFMEAQFDSLYSMMPDARCSLRVGGVGFFTDKAMTSGVTLNREDSEMGSYRIATASIRLKQSDESPANCLCVDATCDVKPAGASKWSKMRVAGRRVAAGVIIVDMETLHET